MANAIKKISVQRGYDVTRYALNCFGGAGGQHACLVADALGMTEVLIHPFSSLLSAYGMGLADIRATRQQAIEETLGAKSLAALKREGGRLGKDAKAEVAGQGVPAGKIKVIVRAHIRYAGTDTPLIVEAGTLAKMKSAFEKAHKARFGFIDRSKELVIEAVSVEAVGGGAKFRERTPQDLARASSPRPPARPSSSPTANGTRPRSITRDQLAPGQKVNGPAIVMEPHQTVVVEDGWRAVDHREEPSGAGALRSAAARQGDRHQGRSDHARGVQQPVHVDRRADGRVAAEHRLLGQHQGAARFLLRGVRRRRLAGRQRAAHAGASRLDGPRGRNHHPREQGPDPTGRFLSDQRALQRRHAHPRPHRLHAGVRRRKEEDPVLGGEPRPSRRHRRHCAGLDVADRHLDRRGRHLHRQLQAGRPRPVLRARALRAPHQGASIRRAIRCRTSTTSRRRSPPTKRACRSCTRWSALFGLNGRARLHEARAGQRRRKRAPRHRPPARQRVQLRGRPGQRHQGQDHGRQEEARGDRRFHRHLAAAGHELQRAGAGDPRGRALRVPRHGRRRHPDERRVPAPDQHHHPRPFDAEAALSGRGRRRQRRGVADGDRHAARRARRHGRRAGHHEQRQLRQRQRISITRRSARARRRARASPAPTPCTPT